MSVLKSKALCPVVSGLTSSKVVNGSRGLRQKNPIFGVTEMHLNTTLKCSLIALLFVTVVQALTDELEDEGT